VTFLAPFFLSLAVLAGVPLLVHLLRRRVTRTVPFPAVRFLQQSQREHDRERLVRNRLLLLLRLLAVFALVAAVARPVASIGGAGHPPAAVAIVLDQSMSTAAVVDGQTLFARLQAAAQSVASQLATADRGWLVTSHGTVLAGDGPTLSAAIAALRPAAGRGDLAGALQRGRRLVRAGAPRTPVLVVVTDGQRSALDGQPEPLALDDVPLVVHVPPLTPPRNRAVVDVSVEPARWTPAGRLRAQLVVPGATPWRAILAQRTLARGTTESIGAMDGPTAVDVEAVATDTGWLAGRVELDPDDFPGDDLRHFAVRVAPPTPVSVSAAAGPFVRAAIEALIDDGRLRRAGGADARDAGTVSIVSAVERARGATVRVAPSDPLQVVAANRALEQAGVPWRYGAVLRDSVTVRVPETAASVAAESRSEGERAPADDGVSLVGTTVALRYRLAPVAGPPTSGASAGEVLLEAGGSPWLVVGRDYALLASPLVPDATDAPLRGAFLPWLRDLVSRRLGDDGLMLAAAPGDTLTAVGQIDSLVSPAGTARPTSGVGLVVPDTTGVYALRRAGRTVGVLVVNAEPEESRVTAWGDSIWQGEWIDGTRQLVASSDALASAVFDRAGGRSIIWPLVALALLALGLEALVARGWLAPRGDGGHAPVASGVAS
jgi:hypothetical protein